MNYGDVLDTGNVYTIQSVMDHEFKSLLTSILNQGETNSWDIESKMTDHFPRNKWVCHIERNKRPYLEVTDKWPSQYACLLKDKTYYVVFRVIDEAASPGLELKI